MIPNKIEEIILEVRLKDKNTLDFKNVLTAYLIDTYELNEIQAAICYQKADDKYAGMEEIYLASKVWAEFANKILKNR